MVESFTSLGTFILMITLGSFHQTLSTRIAHLLPGCLGTYLPKTRNKPCLIVIVLVGSWPFHPLNAAEKLTHEGEGNQTMPDKQNENPICGKIFASKTSTGMMKKPIANNTHLVTHLPPCHPICPTPTLDHTSRLTSTIRTLVDLATLWGSRLATAGSRQSDITTTASKSTIEASSQHEESIPSQVVVEASRAGQLRHSASKNVSHGLALEDYDLDLCSSGDLGMRDRNRGRHWGAVADVDMLFMRALTDGVQVSYL